MEVCRKSGVRVLGAVLGAAVTGALLLASFAPAWTLASLWRYFLVSLTYSCCIAFPSAAALRRVEGTALAQRRGWSIAVRVCVLFGTNLAGCLVGNLLVGWFGLEPRDEYWTRLAFAVRFGIVITLIFGLGMSYYATVRGRLESATLQEERARKLLAESRLSSLESRIHPHFLFNTLNSIASLIPKDPRRAEDMVGKLASLLRFSLDSSHSGLVPLGQELGVVRAYLEIENARFGPRLRYEIDVPPALEATPVPPHSIQSLVENSVKHVIARRPEGGEIRVAASTSPGRIDLEVWDSGPGFMLENVPPGHGLENLSARLALLFGGAARLEAAQNGERAVVRVSIPVSS